MCIQNDCECLSPFLSDISLATTWLWCQGDGKHAGSGNYEGSKHFSWMISFAAAEKQAKEGGRRMSFKREGEGSDDMRSLCWDDKRKEVKGKTQQNSVKMSLGGDHGLVCT